MKRLTHHVPALRIKGPEAGRAAVPSHRVHVEVLCPPEENWIGIGPDVDGTLGLS